MTLALRTAVLLSIAILMQAPALGADAPARPQPPLALPEPPALPARLDDRDLSRVPAETLREEAWASYKTGDVATALTLQRWAVQAEDRIGVYNLACLYALARDVDAAMYWLQIAAAREGIDVQWAKADPDLSALRDDVRWNTVEAYLTAMGTWWSEAGGGPVTLLVVPAGYRPGTPIGAIIGLHGLYSHPSDFADPATYQPLADALQVAFIGVSGTDRVGTRGFRWTEDPERDAVRVASALDEVAERVTLSPSGTILMGFSQGGQTAVELATRDPSRYAGAIALSPGFVGPVRLTPEPTDALRRQGFVIVAGAREHPTVVAAARNDTEALRTAGARVAQRLYPDMSEHALPSDFADRLGDWYAFAVGAIRKL